MVTKGQELWTKLLDDIKNVPGWPYPSPFWSPMELFREATRCYDNQGYVSAISTCTTLTDKLISIAHTSIILPEDRELTCSLCKGKMMGFTKLWVRSISNKDPGGELMGPPILGRLISMWQKSESILTRQSIVIAGKEPEGLKVQAINLGLLTAAEADDAEKTVRTPAHIRIHPQRYAKEYAAWLEMNAADIKLFMEGKTKEIDWFSPVPLKKEATATLESTREYLALMITNYVKKSAGKRSVNVLGLY